MVSFVKQKLFSFMRSHLLFLVPAHKVLFCAIEFKAISLSSIRDSLTLRFLVHSELNFLQGDKYSSLCSHPVWPAPVVGDDIFLHCIFFTSLSKIRCPEVCGRMSRCTCWLVSVISGLWRPVWLTGKKTKKVLMLKEEKAFTYWDAVSYSVRKAWTVHWGWNYTRASNSFPNNDPKPLGIYCMLLITWLVPQII